MSPAFSRRRGLYSKRLSAVRERARLIRTPHSDPLPEVEGVPIAASRAPFYQRGGPRRRCALPGSREVQPKAIMRSTLVALLLMLGGLTPGIAHAATASLEVNVDPS